MIAIKTIVFFAALLFTVVLFMRVITALITGLKVGKANVESATSYIVVTLWTLFYLLTNL